MKTTPELIRWGIIGCGAVTEVKSGPAFQQIEGSTLAAVMRRNGTKARDFAIRHKVPKWYDDADQLIHDPDIDAIYIATPPGSHAEYTVKAAAAGKPVYVDKPMGRRHTECLTMIDACENAGVPLFVAYYRRRLPTFLKVKELLESGVIGSVRFVKIELLYPPFPNDLDRDNLPWRVHPATSGGGYFIDLASHQLDFLDYVFGPIASASGEHATQAWRYTAEDIVCATFRFESGVLGSGVWCFTVSAEDRIDRTEIVGDRGKLVFATFDQVPIRLHTPGNGVREFFPPKPRHVQQPLIQTVVDELRGHGKCPSTGITAARTNWVMDEIVYGDSA